jgi:uncharacterized membrane protein YgcG
MDEGLSALLKSHGVDEKIIVYLGKATTACYTVENFANWVDTRCQLEARILNLTDLKGDPGQLARLKQAWRQADSNITRGIKRSSEGLPHEDLDAPLDDEVYKSRMLIFQQYYRWQQVDSRRLGSDSLFGRIAREFDRRQPSMFSVSRVRCLARAQRAQPPKRERLGNNLIMEMPDEDDDRHHASIALRSHLQQLSVLCFTWSVCGCFDITVDSITVKYCRFEETEAYRFEIEEHAWHLIPKYSEDSVLAYTIAVEEDIRARAVELARQTPSEAWGRALIRAQKEQCHRWQERKDILRSRPAGGGGGTPQGGGGGGGTPHAGGGTPKGGGGGGKKGGGKANGKGNGKAKEPYYHEHNGTQLPSRKKWKTASFTNDNWRFCKNFNDKRGCGKKCPKNEFHGCDVMVGSKPCASTSHGRSRHDVVVHGRPTTNP